MTGDIRLSAMLSGAEGIIFPDETRQTTAFSAERLAALAAAGEDITALEQSLAAAQVGEAQNAQDIAALEQSLEAEAAAARNADNLTTGTLAAERLPEASTQQGNTFNGGSELVKTDSDGQIPESVLPALNAAPSAGSVSGQQITLTAGEALSFGDAGRIASDGKVYKAQADAIAGASAIVMCAAAVAADSEGTFLLAGTATNPAWSLTPGALVYLSTATAGGIQQAAASAPDQVVQVLGLALAAATVYFKPELVQAEIA